MGIKGHAFDEVLPVFSKGFLVLFWPDGQPAAEQGLSVCPVLAADKTAARDAFLRDTPGALVATIASLEELGDYRRQILKLAQDNGADLAIG